MNYASKMKKAIIADLQSLVTTGTLGLVMSNDYSKINPLDQDIPGTQTPVAIVLPPMVSTSAYEDVVTNLREYTWYILIADLPEHVSAGGDGYLEDLMDAVLNVFDLDCTLQGTAIGAVMPAVQEPPGIISGNNITYATFYVTFKAKQLVPAAVKEQ
jgi:hypothetical protein